MREKNHRTFTKSPILVGKVTGDEVVFRSFGTGKCSSASDRLDGVSSESLWKSSDVFSNLRTSSEKDKDFLVRLFYSVFESLNNQR